MEMTLVNSLYDPIKRSGLYLNGCNLRACPDGEALFLEEALDLLVLCQHHNLDHHIWLLEARQPPTGMHNQEFTLKIKPLFQPNPDLYQKCIHKR